ncbi:MULTISPECIES: DUF4440 domain-containing protein [Pseudovibrio]|uniref:DUF4440 domain-containing protein n=1 Tax=Stappiaceae TaxID=2821832 RepID=UPI0023658E10|nr:MULTISPECIES: DUF4440 domain-containing protein [Pseudovibrio]MDD7911120.1 DUF4440 domain-containing protein [Pseudovibrio exalbescens]MDX5593193.1 DUF4440 domain-containing protein [Pseudovibrio sp. SPO723]
MSDESDVELQLSELFDRYADGYDDYDAAAIVDCFAFPCVVWQMDQGHVFADIEELTENIDALLEVHRENGVTQSTYEVISTHISGTTAHVTLDWQQEDDDGEAVFDFTCHYTVIQIDDAWRIMNIVNEPA